MPVLPQMSRLHVLCRRRPHTYLLGVGSLEAEPGRGRPDALGPGMPLRCGEAVLAGERVRSAGDSVLPGDACLAPLPGFRARTGDLFIIRGGDSLLPVPLLNTERPLLPNDFDKFGRLLLCFSENKQERVV